MSVTFTAMLAPRSFNNHSNSYSNSRSMGGDAGGNGRNGYGNGCASINGRGSGRITNVTPIAGMPMMIISINIMTTAVIVATVTVMIAVGSNRQ